MGLVCSHSPYRFVLIKAQMISILLGLYITAILNSVLISHCHQLALSSNPNLFEKLQLKQLNVIGLKFSCNIPTEHVQ